MAEPRITEDEAVEVLSDPVSPSSAEWTETVSLAWEAATGADSIPTIERVYPRARRGAYLCVWPGCALSRYDAEAMWRHVHSAHGKDDLPPADFDAGAWR